MECTQTEDGFRVVDEVGSTVRVSAVEWRETEASPSVAAALADGLVGPAEPSLVVDGETRQLTLPHVHAAVLDLESGAVHQQWLVSESDDPADARHRESFSSGQYLVSLKTSVGTYVRFDGPVTVIERPGEFTRLSFPERTTVSLGFDPSVDRSTETVTVPRTVDGVATAVTTFSAGAETTTADRSWGSVRGPAPRVEWGQRESIPPTVSDAAAETGIELYVPPDREAVLGVASLAYYLGASVTVAADGRPRVELGGRTVSLAADSPLETHDTVTESERVVSTVSRANRLLERVFYTDCVVRGFGEYGDHVVEQSSRRRARLNDPSLFDASLAERVGRSLEADLSAVAGRLPDWPFSLSVRGDYDSLSAVARSVHRLPLLSPARSDVHPQRRVVTEHGDTVDSSAAETAAATGLRGVASSSGSDDTRRHRVRHDWGVVHGWCGAGRPVVSFDAVPAGFRNRHRYTDDNGPLQIAVVLNEVDGSAELQRAVAHYRDRTDTLGLDVDVVTDCTTAELARVFERETDLVHFVGHCEDGELACSDGYFAPRTLSVSNARTFFLNACDSHEAGVTLVRKGSVAGGVTSRDVIDEVAAAVGTRVGWLLVNGFAVGQAVALARRDSPVPSDYVAVGDATHVVSQTDSLVPAVYSVESIDDETVEYTRVNRSPSYHGSVSTCPDDPPSSRPLSGVPRTFEVSHDRFRGMLESADGPVFEDGRPRQPGDLYEDLYG